MEAEVIPVALRVHLSHAALQAIADDTGVDVLHVKGPAVADELRPSMPATSGTDAEETVPIPRLSSDADVLVRPRHLDTYMAALAAHGWRTVYRFETGSPFQHAASLWHHYLGYADIHRRFPGVGRDPEVAFDRFWSTRTTRMIAGYPCQVPAITTQRFLLLLHAARSGGPRHGDVQTVWQRAREEDRQAVRSLARELRGEVALAAATGHLEDFRDDPQHDLWAMYTSGGTRLDEWRARLKAAPNLGAAADVAVRSVLVNTDHLAVELGHKPSAREICSEFFARFAHAAEDLRLAWRRRREQRR